jgi:hypothetical protein
MIARRRQPNLGGHLIAIGIRAAMPQAFRHASQHRVEGGATVPTMP